VTDDHEAGVGDDGGTDADGTGDASAAPDADAAPDSDPAPDVDPDLDDLTLEPARGDDALAAVERLLSASELPRAGVRSGPGRFYVATADGTPVAAGGLEGEGRHALLRSVVVREAARGAGVGTWLCDELEARAAAAGVTAVHLLTTTAEGFFAGRGYAVAERADAPPAVRETSEFRSVCPETATYMRKRLVDPAPASDAGTAAEGSTPGADANTDADAEANTDADADPEADDDADADADGGGGGSGAVDGR
jgi:amino-acid N-acetyltransferase